jgi:hypothetical protein
MGDIHMELLQSIAEFLVPVLALVLAYFTYRRHEVNGALRTALNGWENQVEQTEILYAIEEANANYMVEQDMEPKFETARRRIRARVEAASQHRPSSDLSSPSGTRKQREKIKKLRAKLNVPVRC